MATRPILGEFIILQCWEPWRNSSIINALHRSYIKYSKMSLILYKYDEYDTAQGLLSHLFLFISMSILFNICKHWFVKLLLPSNC